MVGYRSNLIFTNIGKAFNLLPSEIPTQLDDKITFGYTVNPETAPIVNVVETINPSDNYQNITKNYPIYTTPSTSGVSFYLTNVFVSMNISNTGGGLNWAIIANVSGTQTILYGGTVTPITQINILSFPQNVPIQIDPNTQIIFQVVAGGGLNTMITVASIQGYVQNNEVTNYIGQ
jgi:hypothetical protein